MSSLRRKLAMSAKQRIHAVGDARLESSTVKFVGGITTAGPLSKKRRLWCATASTLVAQQSGMNIWILYLQRWIAVRLK
jgi:hypothetical protein